MNDEGVTFEHFEPVINDLRFCIRRAMILRIKKKAESLRKKPHRLLKHTSSSFGADSPGEIGKRSIQGPSKTSAKHQ